MKAGITYGIAESITGDAVALAGLVKLVVLAGLWERLKHPVVGMWESPLGLALALALRRSAWFSREAQKADEALWRILEELKEVAKHPVNFLEIVGRQVKKDALKDLDNLKLYTQNPSIVNDFQGGRIIGRALYQVIMIVLLVMSVAGIAEKLAARFPWLMRLARILRQGGRIEELEGLEEGAKAASGAEGAKAVPKEPSRPKKSPEPEAKTDPRQPRGFKQPNAAELSATDVNGVKPVQVRPGANGKVAITGRQMKLVRDYAKGLHDMGYDVEIFDGNNIPKAASDQWAKLTENGRRLSDSELLQTEMYKANQEWATKLVDQGYTVVDVGNPASASPSPFYSMEKNIIFDGGGGQ